MDLEASGPVVTRRIIARLDVKGDNVVRGMHLEGLRVVGQPEELASRYAAAGIDGVDEDDSIAFVSAS